MALTYPVDTTAKYTVYNKTLDQVHLDGSGRPIIHRTWPRTDGMAIVNLDPDLVILLEVQEDQPVYDSATERIQRVDPVYDVVEETATYSWEIVSLTQDELDAIADREADDAQLVIIKAAYQDLKNGVGTATERLERIEKGLAYILKQFYGN